MSPRRGTIGGKGRGTQGIRANSSQQPAVSVLAEVEEEQPTNTSSLEQGREWTCFGRRDARDQATQSVTVTAKRPPPPPSTRVRWGALPSRDVTRERTENEERKKGGKERGGAQGVRRGGMERGGGRGTLVGGKGRSAGSVLHRALRDGIPSLPTTPPHAQRAPSQTAVGASLTRQGQSGRSTRTGDESFGPPRKAWRLVLLPVCQQKRRLDRIREGD